MTHEEIIMKLIGPVNPVGESNEDERRFENLRVLTDLVYELVEKIYDVSTEKNRYEASIRRAGVFADDFLQKQLKEYFL